MERTEIKEFFTKATKAIAKAVDVEQKQVAKAVADAGPAQLMMHGYIIAKATKAQSAVLLQLTGKEMADIHSEIAQEIK